jgi:hypothetical protein
LLVWMPESGGWRYLRLWRSSRLLGYRVYDVMG